MDRSVHETMEEEKKALLRPKSEQTLEGKVTENKSEIMPDRDENVPCFSLHVKNAPVQEVLQNLAELTHKNIIFSGALSGVITADLDNITPEDALDVVLASTGLVARKERASIIIFNGDSVSDKGQSVKSYRLSYADAEEVAKGLNDLSKEGQVSYNRAANTIIIKGTPLEILQTESVLKGLDIPEKQVKVEAQVIAVNRSYAKELGIDWDFRSLTGSAD